MMRILAALLIYIVLSPAPVLCQTITCDRFEPKVTHRGNQIILSLDTDLPDSTQLMVSVSRSYQVKGKNTKYPLDYYSSKDTVGNWKKDRVIKIGHSVWHSLLQERLRMLAAIGDPDKVSKIDDEITVSFVVPINQSDPRFGPRNKYLVGKRVEMGGLRVVQSDVKVKYSLDSGVKGSHATYNNPNNLLRGHMYRLSKETPLAPERHPSNPLQAAAMIKRMPAGTIIKVLGVDHTTKSNPWYQVLASSPSGAPFGEGWVNSMALIGQEIRSINR